MDDIQWTANWVNPTELIPNSSTSIDFEYTNTSSTTHHIQSVSFAPLWNLQEEVTYDVNVKVSPGTDEILQGFKINIPSGIGGRQGIRLGVEVSSCVEDEECDYQRLWHESLFRIPVRNADRYEALVCVSRDCEHYPVIRKLLENWGFNIHRIDDQQEAIDRFRNTENIPSYFFGILCSDNGESTRELIGNVASIARSNFSNVVIFKYRTANLPNLPDYTCSIEFDPTDTLALITEAGPVLHALRLIKDTKLREGFLSDPMEDPSISDSDMGRDNLLDLIESKIETLSKETKIQVKKAPEQVAWAIITSKIISYANDNGRLDRLMEEIGIRNKNSQINKKEKVGILKAIHWGISREGYPINQDIIVLQSTSNDKIDISGWRLQTWGPDFKFDPRTILSPGKNHVVAFEEHEIALNPSQETKIHLYDENHDKRSELVKKPPDPPVRFASPENITIDDISYENGLGERPIVVWIRNWHDELPADLSDWSIKTDKTGFDPAYVFPKNTIIGRDFGTSVELDKQVLSANEGIVYLYDSNGKEQGSHSYF